MLHFS